MMDNRMLFTFVGPGLRGTDYMEYEYDEFPLITADYPTLLSLYPYTQIQGTATTLTRRQLEPALSKLLLTFLYHHVLR